MEMGTRTRRIDDRLPKCTDPQEPEPRHFHNLGSWSREGTRTNGEIQAVVLVNFTVAPSTRTLYPAGTGSSVMEVFSYSQSGAEVASASGS